VKCDEDLPLLVNHSRSPRSIALLKKLITSPHRATTPPIASAELLELPRASISMATNRDLGATEEEVTDGDGDGDGHMEPALPLPCGLLPMQRLRLMGQSEKDILVNHSPLTPYLLDCIPITSHIYFC
jgi:hypothetical protein